MPFPRKMYPIQNEQRSDVRYGPIFAGISNVSADSVTPFNYFQPSFQTGDNADKASRASISGGNDLVSVAFLFLLHIEESGVGNRSAAATRRNGNEKKVVIYQAGFCPPLPREFLGVPTLRRHLTPLVIHK